MTFTEAAREVLRLSGRPLHYKDITEIAIEKNLLSHVGKSPEVTMGARLAATLKKGGDDNPLVRVKPGVFALRDWDAETIKQGLAINRRPKKKASNGAGEGQAAPVEAAASANDAGASPGADDGASQRAAAAEAEPLAQPPAPDEELRAEIVAAASAVFAEEDDDDQPILKAPEPVEVAATEPADGRRRRRRRRRRGARSGGAEPEASGMPAYTAKPVNGGADGPPRGPQVIELTAADAPALDGLIGARLADAIEIILGSFDRTVGAVSLRQIAETAQRHGKLSGDMQLAQSQIAAAVRADIVRRSTQGLRPRYRLAGGRVGLAQWLLDPDLARAERDVLSALKRYRAAARRAFVRKCAELPAHAFVELCATMLECLGVGELAQVKFPGASGAETLLSGTLYAPPNSAGGRAAEGDGLHLAIVIRRDGRDIGRERVAELRGTAHHYRAATMGWLITTGQIMSGAKEEAAATGVLPVSLIDGDTLARICADHNIAVVSATHPIAVPDVDLFEALKVC